MFMAGKGSTTGASSANGGNHRGKARPEPMADGPAGSSRKPYGYWTCLENIKAEIRALSSDGVVPSATDPRAMLLAHSLAKFPGQPYSALVESMGLRTAASARAEKGRAEMEAKRAAKAEEKARRKEAGEAKRAAKAERRSNWADKAFAEAKLCELMGEDGLVPAASDKQVANIRSQLRKHHGITYNEFLDELGLKSSGSAGGRRKLKNLSPEGLEAVLKELAQMLAELVAKNGGRVPSVKNPDAELRRGAERLKGRLRVLGWTYRDFYVSLGYEPAGGGRAGGARKKQEPKAKPKPTYKDNDYLFSRYRNAETPDEQSRYEGLLMDANQGLVRLIANRWWREELRMQFDDLVSIGNIGLLIAIRRFDNSRRVKLGTYATWWIKQAIGRGIDDDGSIVRIPVHMAEKIRKFRRRNGGNDGAEDDGEAKPEAANGNGLNKVLDAIAASRTISLNAPINRRPSADAQETEVISTMAAEGFSPEEIYMRDRALQWLEDMIGLNAGNPRNAEVLVRRMYGETLQQLGDAFGVTRERIRQVITAECKGELGKRLKKAGVSPSAIFTFKDKSKEGSAREAETSERLNTLGVFNEFIRSKAADGVPLAEDRWKADGYLSLIFNAIAGMKVGGKPYAGTGSWENYLLTEGIAR